MWLFMTKSHELITQTPYFNLPQGRGRGRGREREGGRLGEKGEGGEGEGRGRKRISDVFIKYFCGCQKIYTH